MAGFPKTNEFPIIANLNNFLYDYAKLIYAVVTDWRTNNDTLH